MTLREGFDGGGMREEGAIEAFERTLVGGIRSMEAADGGGRSGALFLGRGAAGITPMVGAFNGGG